MGFARSMGLNVHPRSWALSFKQPRRQAPQFMPSYDLCVIVCRYVERTCLTDSVSWQKDLVWRTSLKTDTLSEPLQDDQ